MFLCLTFKLRGGKSEAFDVQRRAKPRAALSALCTPSMGMNLWGESPLLEDHHHPMRGLWWNNELKATAIPRGVVGRKPEANLRTDEQEHHTRRSLEASWHIATKPCDQKGSVNDAVVQRKFMLLSGEICSTSSR